VVKKWLFIFCACGKIDFLKNPIVSIVFATTVFYKKPMFLLKFEDSSVRIKRRFNQTLCLSFQQKTTQSWNKFGSSWQTLFSITNHLMDWGVCAVHGMIFVVQSMGWYMCYAVHGMIFRQTLDQMWFFIFHHKSLFLLRGLGSVCSPWDDIRAMQSMGWYLCYAVHGMIYVLCSPWDDICCAVHEMICVMQSMGWYLLCSPWDDI